MDPPLAHRHFGEVEWAHAFDTGDIDPVLVRIGAALVKGVDAALGAEVVLRFVRMKLIERERLFALGDRDISQARCDSHGTAHAAQRAIASASATYAFGQAHGKAHRTAMAGGLKDGAGVGFIVVHKQSSTH